jgi:NitT/TauT family transport system ATP-binding protein
VAEERIAPRVAELLELGHLTGFAGAYPHQLSGGMRRRVALLMSLAVEPRIVLMDEPFGALDTHTKTHLHRELMEIWRKLKQTIVLVTHDLDEAITLSDRVIVLSSPPSTVLLDERICIPQPRDVFTLRESAQFVEHFQSIWSVLGNQFRAAA